MTRDQIITKLRSRCTVTETGCWEFAGTNAQGYGQITVAGVYWYAHRLAYTLLVGNVPKGLELDHLCRNRACCNPEHLEAVTHRVNCQRGHLGAPIGNQNARKTAIVSPLGA